jgi:putative glycosyltransferase (TIGR04348 family)
MRLFVASTTPPTSRKGNQITAARWGRLLRALGHRVVVREQYEGGRFDLLVALHARRSVPSVQRFQARNPDAPVVLALTGTDLSHDIHHDARARASLDRATRLVVLQPMALRELPASVRGKARVIRQSCDVRAALSGAGRPRPDRDALELCVLGHLRPVKDPLRAAEAARLLPADSRVRVVQIGAAIAPGMEAQAREEEETNPRYRWLGEMPQRLAVRRLAACRALVITSHSEGGANVLGEAICSGVPVLSSKISGVIGTLGPKYPGYFAAGNTRALARLMRRFETDAAFRRELLRRCREFQPLFRPSLELQSWRRLLAEL